MAVLDIEKLVAEANQHLKLQQKIHPEDPLLAAVSLQNVMLQAQVDFLNKKMEENLHLFNAASELQVEQAKQVAASLITSAGNHIEQQLDKAAQQWESRLNETAQKTVASLGQTALVAKMGGLLLFAAGCIAFGVAISHFLLQILPHKG